MKSFIIVVIWSICFLIFGIEVENRMGKLSESFNNQLEVIDKEMYDENFDNAYELSKIFTERWEKESKVWYYFLNHEYFDDVYFYSKILTHSIEHKNFTNSFEYIEKIKMAIDNIIQYEKLDLDHVF
ncbi:MAG: DUF4363 family protein [Peptostreptococcaceae bacterium]